METSTQYNFKLVDFHISRVGYLLKVAMLAPSSSSYRLVYVPYGKYPSVLMLDYLVSSMKELPSELNDALVQAVKQDLSAEMGIVLLASEPDRVALISEETVAVKQTSDGTQIDKTIEATRPSYYGTQIDQTIEAARPESRSQLLNEIKTAFRPIDQPTRVFREVHLSKNVQRDLDKLKLSDLAYRIQGQELHIDVIGSSKRLVTSDLAVEKGGGGHRNIASDTVVERELQVNRERVAEILIPKSNVPASRIITAKAVTLLDSNQAHRIDNSAQAFIPRESAWGWLPERFLRAIVGKGSLGHRINTQTAWINYEKAWASRISLLPTLVDHHVQALREVEHDLLVTQKIIESMKIPARLTFVDRVNLRARLKSRQYPSHLAYFMQGNRNGDWQMFLEKLSSSGRRDNGRGAQLQHSQMATRYNSHQGYTLRSLVVGRREFLRNKGLWIVKNSFVLGERIKHEYIPKSWPSNVLREIMWGRRDTEVDTYIEQNFVKAVRDISKGAWVMREIEGGTKARHNALVNQELKEGKRSKDRAIYIPKSALNGSTRRSKNVGLSWTVQAARMENKEAYLEYIQQAERYNQKPTHLDGVLEMELNPKESVIDDMFEGSAPTIFGLMPEEGWLGERPDPEGYFGDDWLADKQIVELRGLIEEALTAEVSTAREGLYDEMFVAFKQNRELGSVLLEEMLLAHIVREMPAYILEVIYGYHEFPAELMDEVLVGIRDFLNPSFAEAFDFLLGERPKFSDGFIEQFLVGARERLDALIDSGIVGFQEARPSILTFGVVSSREDERAGVNLNEMIAAHEEPKPAVIKDHMIAHEEANPSIISEELVAHEEAKPSVLEQGTFAHEEARPSDLGGETIAEDVFHPSILHIANPLGYFEPDESFIPEGSEAFKPIDRSAQVGEGLLEGQEPERPATLGEGTEGNGVGRGIDMVENPLAHISERPSMIGEDFEALLKQRIAELSKGFVLGAGGQRAGHIADIYLLGEAGVRDGFIPEEDWANYAKFALEQAIIAEGMFATEPDRAALLVESILAFKGFSRDAVLNGEGLAGSSEIRDGFSIANEEFADRNNSGSAYLGEGHSVADTDPDPSYMGDSIEAGTDPTPSFIDVNLIAEKPSDAAHIIEGILGDKELAEAIIQDYLLAQKRIQHGNLMDGLTATEQIKKAFLDKIGEMGQGLIYDYSDDILESGMDPELWDGGYGVPEDYDPHNPFNDYYPWTEELDSLALGQDDWVRFDSEPQTIWHRNPDRGEFYCDTDIPSTSGYYRNDFNHEDYEFEVSFKVEQAAGDDAAGIIFRYTDPQNYYMFMVHGGDVDGTLEMNRPMQLYQIRDGVRSQIGVPMNPFAWIAGKWQLLRVSVIGNRIKLSVNGRLQYDFTD